jgi:copper transporter 1
MLFTWSTKDLCIVFHGWHITGVGSLIFSLLAIVLMTAGYEAVREVSRRYDIYAKRIAEGRTSGDDLASKLFHLIYPHREPLRGRVYMVAT